MRKVTLLLFNALLFTATYGQTTTAELYNSKDFQALIKLEEKSNILTGEELYMVGFAFFKLENDEKAIEFYDKAIRQGYDNGIAHFYKSVSLTYLKKYDEAVTEIDISLKKEPVNQEYMNQKGLIYKVQGLEDKALDYFEEATRFPNTYGEPYFWVAYIYHGKQDLEKALKLYYVAAEKVPQQNPYYAASLQSIGKLEYSYTENYQKSALAYAEAIAVRPKDYEIYPKLIKAYNAAKEYSKADAVFDLMKAAYKNNELPDMKYKNVGIDEYQWNKQRLSVYKSLDDPKAALDVWYKIYLLNKSGDAVERIFTVEKTIQVGNGSKYLLCEQKIDSHLTYPYSWKTDNIPLEELKKAIILVLEGSMQKMATAE
jgi:tetratricopeptide (TPR) repeat protein